MACDAPRRDQPWAARISPPPDITASPLDWREQRLASGYDASLYALEWLGGAPAGCARCSCRLAFCFFRSDRDGCCAAGCRPRYAIHVRTLVGA